MLTGNFIRNPASRSTRAVAIMASTALLLTGCSRSDQTLSATHPAEHFAAALQDNTECTSTHATKVEGEIGTYVLSLTITGQTARDDKEQLLATLDGVRTGPAYGSLLFTASSWPTPPENGTYAVTPRIFRESSPETTDCPTLYLPAEE